MARHRVGQMKYLITVFFLSLIVSVQGQIHSKILNSKGGLSGQDYNHFVLKDSKGYVWISSSHGLNRYDGQVIKQYTEGIKGNWIQGQLVEDNDGNIWTSTYEYLLKYDAEDDKIESFKIFKDSTFQEYYHVIGLDTVQNDLYVTAGFKLIVLKNCDPSSIEVLPIEIRSRRFEILEYFDGKPTKIIGIPLSEDSGFEYFFYNDNGEWKKEKIVQFGTSNSSFITYDGIRVNNKVFIASSIGLLEFELQDSMVFTKQLTNYGVYALDKYKENLIILTSKKNGVEFF